MSCNCINRACSWFKWFCF